MASQVDFKQLRRQMLVLLSGAGGEWVAFKTVAQKLTADGEMAQVFIALANQEPNLFVNSKDKAVKLTVEGVQEAKQLDSALVAAHHVAAKAVHKYANQLKPRVLPITDVGPGRLVLDRYLHAVTVDLSDDDLRLADDTPVTFKSKSGATVYGKVAGIARDEAVVYVAFGNEVLPVDLPAHLEVDTRMQWTTIASHLEQQKSTPSLFEILQTKKNGDGLQSPDSSNLATQLENFPAPWAKLLWGPPGAGKTFCVGRLVAGLVAGTSPDRVLVVAPSNVAVDAATLEVLAAFRTKLHGAATIAARRVVRYGYPRDARVLAEKELFGSVQLEALSKSIERAFAEIRRLRLGRASEEQIAVETTRVQQYQEQRRKLLAQHLAKAQVVLTTLASLTTGQGEVLSSAPYETVIVDEASMVASSQVLLLSAIATRRLLLAGDPRQLAPICEWHGGYPPDDVQEWIAADPYQFVGLAEGDSLDRVIQTADDRVARVVSQRRCHPEIWAITAPLYPDVTSIIDLQGINAIRDAAPMAGKSVVLLDVSSGQLADKTVIQSSPDPELLAEVYESSCLKVGESWQNPPTAMLSIDVAREAHANSPTAKIIIVTPYRAQVRLLRTWLREESKADPTLQNIEVGTVHAFQGGEADIVIFDLVDGYPRTKLGQLLRGDTGCRLVNVAATRAKAKLFVVAHRAWFSRDTVRPHIGLLDRLLFGVPDVLKVVKRKDGTPPSGGRPESKIEEVLVEALIARRPALPPFTLQHRIPDKNGRIVSRADIAFLEQHVAVYCDGAKYHLVPNQWQKDLRQRRRLTALGWKPIAFSGAEIMGGTEKCIDEISALVWSG